MTTEIDIEQLNEASQALYDLAFHRGVRQGHEETTDEQGRRHATGLLELAQRVLENPSDDDDEHKWRMAIARMILGRTPMMVGQVTRALSCLSYHGLQEPTREDAARALAVVTEGLAELEHRRIAKAVAEAQ